MSYLLMTFQSTHDAIKTEKALKDFEIEMIPTPRQLSTSCGLSLKALAEDLKAIQNILDEDYNRNNQAYLVERRDSVLTFKKV